MPKYTYVAIDSEGQPASGLQRSANREAAEAALSERQLRGVQLTERRHVLDVELSPKRVKREEVMHLSRQLGAFIRAGLPIIDAVHSLGVEASNPSVRRMMSDVEEGLRHGNRLSDCLDNHPRIFPEFYRGILRSAELTGQLDVVLDQLARYLERDLEARRKIKSALVYPSMIVLMAIATVAVLAGFVLPRFKVFFANMNATLPLPTRILLAFTDFISQWWWALAGGLVALVVSYLIAVRTPGGRHARDYLLLKVPVVGIAVEYALVERFCRILSSMAGAGVPLPEALRVATDSLRNVVFMRALAHVAEAMIEGEGLAGPLSATGLFPGTAARMMRVGEETGTFEAQLEVTAHYYEGELDYKLKKLTAMFEPAVIVVMGLIVGFVAVALVSAMYGVFDQVNQ
ncbi:type II secretion system F family protein [Lentzea aerocolonigenes]|uniref:type II secretion system F family protein n=1 Tax=Lentzea aerocolonigenes TaxID=68170 RepID=UPI0004C2C7EB|nr:type II secretion system F family protein [Lentzea aerocolonigenes]MCP2243561.1 type IV pilus assembly protein PilC [Lentzea aerocolonigenes]